MPATLALLLLLFPSIALADAGIPMLVIVWPLSAFVILPVVAVEGWIVRNALSIDWRPALIQMAKANLLSTVIGIPLAWAASVAVEFVLAALVMNASGSNSYPPSTVGEIGSVILSAPWLGSYENGTHWIFPVATTVLLVPFFFASYWVESWYVATALSPTAPGHAKKAIWQANLLSYLLLFVCCISWLLFGLATQG